MKVRSHREPPIRGRVKIRPWPSRRPKRDGCCLPPSSLSTTKMPVSNAKQHEAEGLPYPSSSSQADAAASPRPTSARARLGRLALAAAAAAGWLLVHSTPVGKSVLNRFNSGASAWPDDSSESSPPFLTAVEVEMLAKSSCPAQVEPLNVGPDWVRVPPLLPGVSSRCRPPPALLSLVPSFFSAYCSDG